eukprot:INCI11710.2.p1 GENE.INCI11710.2~~INCI11710.2.p1  ORF type:complete len:350 (-),score=53.29 INCI11710.2:126-1175(-)
MSGSGALPPGSEQVIRFDGRPDYRCRLFVTVPRTLTLEEFRAMFSRVSLVHQAFFFERTASRTPPSSTESLHSPFGGLAADSAAKDVKTGLIAYYAPIFAHQARRIFHGLQVRGGTILVSQMRKRVTSTYKNGGSYPLDSRECLLLLNHFLGFNGWSTRILEVRQQPVQVMGRWPTFNCKCSCRLEVLAFGTRVIVPKSNNNEVRVVGSATVSLQTPTRTKAEAIKQAQKVAVTEARKNALQYGLELVVRLAKNGDKRGPDSILVSPRKRRVVKKLRQFGPHSDAMDEDAVAPLLEPFDPDVLRQKLAYRREFEESGVENAGEFFKLTSREETVATLWAMGLENADEFF